MFFRISLVALFLLNSSLAFAAAAEQRFIFLSGGGAITVFRVNLGTGKLTEIQKNPGAGTTAISSDQQYLYRVDGKTIESFRIGDDGKLTSLGANPTPAPAGFLSIDATDRFLAGSNYGGGSVALWKIGKGDRIAHGELAAQVSLEKAVHSSVFDPTNRFLLVPATTPNKVFQLRFDADKGALVPHDPPFASGPTGDGTAQQPRHLVFHPNGKIAYTTLERESPGVGVWTWDAENGKLKVIQNHFTLPEGFEGNITTADLHLTPDAKFLYVSNRDLTDRNAITGKSSLVGFRVEPESGKLSLIGHTPCPQIPRGFAIDHAGEFLYAAGQVAAKLAVYRIDPNSGNLSPIEMLDTRKGPNWVRCVTKITP